MGVVVSAYLIRGIVEMDFSEQWLVCCTEAGDCNCAGREIGNQARNFELHILNR
jgi:hypothetical protein